VLRLAVAVFVLSTFRVVIVVVAAAGDGGQQQDEGAP
jgi:hypothetical protein